jgi:hypothetical protein
MFPFGLATLADPRHQITEGLRPDVPGTLKRIVEISQDKMCEEQQQGRDRHRDDAERQVVEGKEE